MDLWEHFSHVYSEWADVQRELDTKGEEGWEAVSMVPVVIEALPVTTRMRFYLVMKRRILEPPESTWPKPRLVTDSKE
jgi:hypothetical protein